MNHMHRIHLREPWEVDGARHTRKFGRPRTVDPSERIWLVIESATGECRLNGRSLGALVGRASRFDVTEALLERNCLEIALLGGDLGGVALEIGPGETPS